MSSVTELTDVAGVGSAKPFNVLPDDWIKAELGDSCFVTKLAGFEYTQHFDYSVGGEIIAVRVLNLKKGRLNLNSVQRIPRLVSEALPRSKLSKHDIVISYVGTVGEVALIDEDDKYHLAPNVAKISPDNTKIIGEYLVQVLTSDNTQKSIQLLGSITSQPSLSMGNLRKVYIPSPPLPEQQKIAQILTSVDEVIEKTQAQIDKLKDLKTAMMQELLTKGIGHVEFKDSPVGRIPVGWEVVTMRDICVTRQGLQIPISSRYSEPAENRFIYLTIKFINTGFNPAVAQYIENPSKRVICNEDDIILARTGATGKVVTGVSGVFHNNFFMIDYSRSKIKRSYLVQYLNSPYIQTEIKNRAGTTTIPDLNHGDFYSLPMLIPPMDEQSKIAEVLVSNDNLILNKTKKLNALISTKKALMQDLLTGKVRVNTEQSNTTLAMG